MKQLAIAFALSALAAPAANAAQVRYDFSGTVSPSAGALATDVGFDGASVAYSGFIAFDAAAADEEPDPGFDLFQANDFALSIGGLSFDESDGAGAAAVDLVLGEFSLSFSLGGEFAPSVTDEFLQFLLTFSLPGLSSGVAQSPDAANGGASVVLSSNEDVLFGEGGVTAIDVTVVDVPEPATLAVMAGALALLGGARRRRARAALG